MTLVNFKTRPVAKNFNNAVDTFFAGFPSVFGDDFATAGIKHFAPANVLETENGYQLEIVAPGLEKDNFAIDLNKDILTVSAERKSENEVKNEKHLRREYKFQSFKRSFTIDENIDAETIDAKYTNGVLILTLPKKAEVKAPVKQISIQ